MCTDEGDGARPGDPFADAPESVRPLIRQVERAVAAGDGAAAVAALRRLIAAVEGDPGSRWLWAASQQELGDLLSRVPADDPARNLEEVIAAYEAALEFFTPDGHPTDYARVQNNLGNAYRLRRVGSAQENVERSIAAFEAALAIRRREADPYGWARTQNNLGNAYAQRGSGEPDDNWRRAVDAFRAALEVHDIVEYPSDYAMDHTNLALTYQEKPGGADVASLDLAMASFLCAQLVHSPTRDMRRHRRLVLSLADAFHARVELTPQALRGDVYAALRAVTHLLIQATVYFGIPTNMPEEPPPRSTGGEADGLAAAFLPEPSLFDGYIRDRRRVMPLQDLLALATSEAGESDPEDRVELLRTALSRPDLVLPRLRAMLLDELGTTLMAIGSGDTTSHQEEAIAALGEALEALDPAAQPHEWTVVNNHMAVAYASRRSGDHAENLEWAIQYGSAAVREDTAGSEEWVQAVALLGQLYRERRFGDPRDNLAQAEEAFHLALSALTEESAPYQWARVNNSLGLTYQQLGTRQDTLVDAALAAFDDAARVLTRERHPYEWAGVQTNRARALWQGSGPDRPDRVEEAIAGFTACLTVHTRADYPEDWARTTHNLGQAYRSRFRGDPAENLRMAAECFRAALEVHTLAERPADHRRTAGALGEAEARRGDWQAAHEAFASAARAGDLLAAVVNTGTYGHDEAAREGHEVGELDAYALVRLGRLEEAVEAVEAGRARSLAEAFRIRTAAPERIGDPDRQARYVAAREALDAAQAAVDEVPWRRRDPVGGGLDDAEARRQALALAAVVRVARERFTVVVEEVRRAGDPADFLAGPLTVRQIADGVDRPVVYLLTTEWGGLALAVRPADPSVLACPLPALTDEAVNSLVQVSLDSGHGALVGGYGAAQEGAGLPWFGGQWTGDSFAEKARGQHDACVAAGVEATLDAATQALLRSPHPGLAEILVRPLDGLEPEELARVDATLHNAFLRAELLRCLPVLATVAMRPLTEWLTAHDLTAVTLVPCGVLPAFPLLAAPLEGDAASPATWTTVADRLGATVAPSARSVLAGRADTAPRSGVYALGDPRPTHQELRWGEAEAMTVADLAGDSSRARVREAATRDWLVEGLRDGRAVVASCHGEFDAGDFLRSRLLLAGGEALTLAEALGNQVTMAGLRLLVLSACQSAVMNVRGAQGEVRSLAVAMLQAGAEAVIGALWAVDDRATYLLMVRFAQEWLPVMNRQGPAAALTRAQAWLRTATNGDLAAWAARPEPQTGDPALAAVRGRGTRYALAQAEQLIGGLAGRAGAPDDTPYADPIFWAGFQTHGR